MEFNPKVLAALGITQADIDEGRVNPFEHFPIMGGEGDWQDPAANSYNPFNTGPAPVDPTQQSIDDFLKNIDPIQKMLLGANFQGMSPEALAAIRGQLGGIGKNNQALGAQAGTLGQQFGGEFNQVRDAFGNIASNNDPRFAAYATGQNALLEQQRSRALQSAAQENARQGIGGTAALNDTARINAQYDPAQLNLYGQLGMQQMGRQDTALGNMAAITGQNAQMQGQALGKQGQFNNQNAALAQGQFGNEATSTQMANQAEQQRLDAASVAGQNYAVDPALRIGYTAAQRAGQSDGGKGGLFGGK